MFAKQDKSIPKIALQTITRDLFILTKVFHVETVFLRCFLLSRGSEQVIGLIIFKKPTYYLHSARGNVVEEKESQVLGDIYVLAMA